MRLAEGDEIWTRGGVAVEDLPDPFAGALQPPETPEQEKPRRRRRWPLILYSISALLAVMLVWLVITAPLSRALEPLADPALLLLSEDGRPIALRGAIKEAPVDVAKLDPLTPAAFVSIEDRRFYRHWGIDPRGIGRAMVANMRGGGVRQGGSTITQQLAKTSFLSGDRTMKRKAQEVIIAFWLEAWLSKEEILSRYLSSVYFGDGVYGLRAASKHYFQRDPERLTLAQSAMLAGLVQAPSRLAPTRHLAAAQKRSRLVLGAMADTGKISERRARITTPARPVRQEAKLPAGTYFADWVAPSASAAFESDFGQVKVRTTLDRDLQRLAVRAITRARVGDAQAALVAMRPDGRVVAMVGGKNYAESPFNRVTQARRQPGSAFKLFVYLAALRAGWTPDSMIDDKPITIGGWTPLNSDRVYRGRITLREAFARSSNAATVRLSEEVGRENVIRAARDLGIHNSVARPAQLGAWYGGRQPVGADISLRGGRQRPLSNTSTRIAGRGSAGGSQGLFPVRRFARPAARLVADAGPAVCGREQWHRPSCRACRAHVREDRNDARKPRCALHRFCRQSGGRRMGRPRRQQIAGQDQRRDRTGRRLAKFHDLGDRDRRVARTGSSG